MRAHLVRRWDALTFRRLAPVWTFATLESRVRHLRGRDRLESDAARVVGEMKKVGIAQTTLARICPQFDIAVLQSEASRLLAAEHIQAEIRLRARSAPGTRIKKPYLLSLWPQCGGESPFLEMSLDVALLNIVAAYLGAWPRLLHTNLWYTLPSAAVPVASQRWHRDPEDRRLVKLFLYLSDVDEGSGPFCYFPETHSRGRLWPTLRSRVFAGDRYPPDEAVTRHLDLRSVRTCTGQTGTLVLCDTAGMHRGGHAIEKSRLVFNAVYVTDGADPRRSRPRNYEMPAERFVASPIAAFAVGGRIGRS